MVSNRFMETNTATQALAAGMVEWVNACLTSRVAAGMTEQEAMDSFTADLRRRACPTLVEIRKARAAADRAARAECVAIHGSLEDWNS